MLLLVEESGARDVDGEPFLWSAMDLESAVVVDGVVVGVVWRDI